MGYLTEIFNGILPTSFIKARDPETRSSGVFQSWTDLSSWTSRYSLDNAPIFARLFKGQPTNVYEINRSCEVRITIWVSEDEFKRINYLKLANAREISFELSAPWQCIYFDSFQSFCKLYLIVIDLCTFSPAVHSVSKKRSCISIFRRVVAKYHPQVVIASYKFPFDSEAFYTFAKGCGLPACPTEADKATNQLILGKVSLISNKLKNIIANSRDRRTEQEYIKNLVTDIHFKTDEEKRANSPNSSNSKGKHFFWRDVPPTGKVNNPLESMPTEIKFNENNNINKFFPDNITSYEICKVKLPETERIKKLANLKSTVGTTNEVMNIFQKEISFLSLKNFNSKTNLKKHKFESLVNCSEMKPLNRFSGSSSVSMKHHKNCHYISNDKDSEMFTVKNGNNSCFGKLDKIDCFKLQASENLKDRSHQRRYNCNFKVNKKNKRSKADSTKTTRNIKSKKRKSIFSERNVDSLLQNEKPRMHSTVRLSNSPIVGYNSAKTNHQQLKRCYSVNTFKKPRAKNIYKAAKECALNRLKTAIKPNILAHESVPINSCEVNYCADYEFIKLLNDSEKSELLSTSMSILEGTVSEISDDKEMNEAKDMVKKTEPTSTKMGYETKRVGSTSDNVGSKLNSDFDPKDDVRETESTSNNVTLELYSEFETIEKMKRAEASTDVTPALDSDFEAKDKLKRSYPSSDNVRSGLDTKLETNDDTIRAMLTSRRVRSGLCYDFEANDDAKSTELTSDNDNIFSEVCAGFKIKDNAIRAESMEINTRSELPTELKECTELLNVISPNDCHRESSSGNHSKYESVELLTYDRSNFHDLDGFPKAPKHQYLLNLVKNWRRSLRNQMHHFEFKKRTPTFWEYVIMEQIISRDGCRIIFIDKHTMEMSIEPLTPLSHDFKTLDLINTCLEFFKKRSKPKYMYCQRISQAKKIRFKTFLWRKNIRLLKGQILIPDEVRRIIHYLETCFNSAEAKAVLNKQFMES